MLFSVVTHTALGYYPFIMKVRELLKRLAADVWVERKSGGSSHRQFVHPVKPGVVTMAFHGRNADIPIGTAKAALKAAGLEE